MAKYFVPSARILLYTISAASLGALIYIVQGTSGAIAHEATLMLGTRCALAICLSALVLAILRRSVPLSGMAAAFVLLWLIGPLPGYTACLFGGLSGGYDRYSNCGREFAILSGFFAAGSIAIIEFRSAALLGVVSTAILAGTLQLITFSLKAPLANEFQDANFVEECFVVESNYYTVDLDPKTTMRLSTPNDLNLGRFVGEQSPRIWRVNEDGSFVWRYAQSKFERSELEGLTKFCGMSAE